MAQLLLYPGETSELVDLQGFLRDLHEDNQAARLKELRERKENAATKNERVEPSTLQALGADLVSALERDARAVARAVARRLDTLLEEPLEPVPDYVPRPELDGITVRFRVLSEPVRRQLAQMMGQAIVDIDNARDIASQALAMQALSDARAQYVDLTVAEVHGLEDRAGAELGVGHEHFLGALRIAGLHVPLYEAASAFQVLPAKKGLRFGLPAGSASSASPAPGVPTTSAPSAAASAAPSGLTAGASTSAAPSTNLTPALDGR